MADASPQPVNILLVDDTPAKLLTYEVVLGELGENLLTAKSADEAFQILLKTDVALVLTDVQMPTLDGFEFAKLLRGHPRFEALPIVFVSAVAQSDLDRLRGYASGAVDYVVAPVVPELLRAKVKVFVDVYRKRRELQHLKSELERRVAERTAELEASNRRYREGEQRYRALVDNANDIVATLDLNFHFTSVNPAVERILGYTPEEMVGTLLTAYVPGDQLPMHEAMLKRKLDGQESTRYEMELLAKDGQRRFTLEVSSKLLLNGEGVPVGIHAISRDVTERKEAEARQLVLVRELQHRTKNLLAVVQSIVTNTHARSRDLRSANEAIVGRLHALARAQDFVVSGVSGGVPLRDLIDYELSAFATRTEIEGIPVVLGGAFAQQFALVVHELATNAAKYGSLSIPSGRLLVRWEIKQQADEPSLIFSWRERDGPLVRAPTEAGFGNELIAATLSRAPRISYNGSGLEFTVQVPLSDVMTTGTANVPD
jgi:PAS domain S-box-containing protein